METVMRAVKMEKKKCSVLVREVYTSAIHTIYVLTGLLDGRFTRVFFLTDTEYALASKSA